MVQPNPEKFTYTPAGGVPGHAGLTPADQQSKALSLPPKSGGISTPWSKVVENLKVARESLGSVARATAKLGDIRFSQFPKQVAAWRASKTSLKAGMKMIKAEIAVSETGNEKQDAAVERLKRANRLPSSGSRVQRSIFENFQAKIDRTGPGKRSLKKRVSKGTDQTKLKELAVAKAAFQKAQEAEQKAYERLHGKNPVIKDDFNDKLEGHSPL